MKKKFKVEVDCAGCAAKIEEAIRRIDGVNAASLSFMTQKLTVDADEASFDRIMTQAQRICSRVDSDSKIIV